MVECGQHHPAPVTVGDPVVAGQGGVDEGMDGEHAVDGHGAVGDAPEADDGDLGRDDDRESGLHPPVAEVGHGDGRVRHLRAAEAPGPGPGDEVDQGGHGLVEAQAVGVVDRRCHQPSLSQWHRHPEVDGAGGPEGAVDEVAVELGHPAQGEGGGPEEQGGREQAPVQGPLSILRFQPGHGGGEVDVGP